MSNIFIDPCNLDKTELFRTTYELWRNFYAGGASSVFPDSYYNPNVTHIEPTLDGYNFEALTCECTSSNANMMDFYNRWYKAKYTKTGNRRICLVRFKYKVTNYYSTSSDSHYESYIYFPLANCSDIYQDFVYLPQGNTNTRRNIFLRANGTGQIDDLALGNYATTMDALSVRITELKSNIPFITPANLEALIGDNTYAPRYQTSNNYNHAFCGIPLEVNRSYGGFECITQIPETIPVFEETATQAILNYLSNGDDSGRVDPFDPNNPSVRKVTDFKSDFKTYVTRNGKDVMLKTIAYNSQYITMGDSRDDEYGIYCFKRSAGSDGQYGNWSFVSKATQISYPTINIKPVFTTGAPYLELFYGFAKVGDDTRTYGFSISLESDSAKEYGFKIKEVHCYGDFWHSSTYTGTSRTSITDGYQYTQQTDNKYMQVLFRAVTLDDLHDTADDGYDDKGDTEDTSTGTTASEVCGHGLGTYKVSQAGFDAINDALWSTDWTQLFKSNTIDPVKCVISCKGIPFDHSGTATDEVYIANQRIECSAGKCNPVNTYNIGSYTIQAINNNFTDMTMTKVRVYLPYIAWVELPAEEVISRVGRAEVGLSSVTKLLNFKYIVDFVDGSCRCVISVNGTERWFFDGNCGVDIPVTSDNHTSAINNAIKSGVATVMNVGLAVGSAYAGNAMGVASGVTGAIGSLANTIPTYNYSATANSSGYINHSMGNKIVIVIESPNIQMPNGYGHKYGFPCMRNLTLGSLSGYTKCESVDLTGINGTNYELNYIKSALESGVYL